MLEQLTFTRVVASPAALDAATFPADTIVLRTAADEVLLLGTSAGDVTVDDSHAIIVDDTGWAGAWFSPDEAARILRDHSTWDVPAERPAFAQGMLAHAPVKVWLETDRVLVAVPHVGAVDLAERIAS